jgi:hypothetical protein
MHSNGHFEMSMISVLEKQDGSYGIISSRHTGEIPSGKLHHELFRR